MEQEDMIPLYKPYMADITGIEDVLYSGQLAYGKYGRDFEDALRKYFNTEYLLVTNSFNTAISVALEALGLKYGDEVIASPMACLASTQPYQSSGMKIQWCDIDSKRGTLDPNELRKMISARTKAIVHNHFCGYPGYINEINQIASEHGIPVIDDGIECFGSEYEGDKIGNCGTSVTVFSLNPVRIPNCIDGGIVIFRDKNIYEKGLLIRDCGIDRTLFRDEFGEINPQYDISIKGYSATMSDINGFIGLKQMRDADILITKQRKNAKYWNAYFEDSSIKPIRIFDSNPNYWVYGILTDNKIETMKYFRKHGFYASGVHYLNNKYTVFGKQERELKGAEDFYNRFLALPCGWWMNGELSIHY